MQIAKEREKVILSRHKKVNLLTKNVITFHFNSYT